MSPVDILCVAAGIGGIAFGANCYYHLWRWAKFCQRAQIAVAYKNKVKICHPIQEWMLMVNLLKPDETGRTVYSLGGTRVAIIRGKPITMRRDLAKMLRSGALKLKRSKKTLGKASQVSQLSAVKSNTGGEDG